MTKEQRMKLESLAKEYQADENRPKLGPANSFIAGAEVYEKILLEDAPEFDPESFRCWLETYQQEYDINPLSIEVARWQFEQDKIVIAAKDARIKELEDEISTWELGSRGFS